MYIVKSTVIDADDKISTVNSNVFPDTYAAWDAALDVLDASAETWTDVDALQSYAAAVKTAVNADQALPGMVAMLAPNGSTVVLGVIEYGKP
jgi:hypothetical protein